MDRSRWLMTLLGALALAMAGCQFGDVTTDAQPDADLIAAAVAGPSDGMTQEALDVGAYLFGGSGGSGSMADARGISFPGGHARFFSADLASFVWDGATKSYVRTRVDFDVALPGSAVHVDSVLVRVKFFESPDATGDGYGPVDFSSGFDLRIGSMTYHREISATVTNLATGTVTAHTAQSDLASTDIDVAAGTVTIDGTRTRSFGRAFTNGRTAVGTIDDTVSDVALSWDAAAGTASWSGTLAYVLDASVTRANGTTVARHQEGTVEFSGSSTFTVTVDGVPYRYRLADGSPVNEHGTGEDGRAGVRVQSPTKTAA
jgi:hypothetical protein